MTAERLPTTLVIALTAALCCQTAATDDWPRWRGPNADGVSAESDWDPTSLATEPRVVWSINVGPGHSAPAVRGRNLYTMGNVDDEDIVYCLNAETGAEIWRRGYGSPPGEYGGPRATPVLAGERLYTVSRWGQVVCLDASSGRLEWWRKLSDLGIHLPKWGVSGSPRVHGNAVILNAGSHGVALDATTGETIWASPPGTGGYATPVVFPRNGRDCVAIFAAKGLSLVDVANGSKILSYPWSTDYDVNAADPVVSGTRVFVSSGYETGCALLDVGGEQATKVWRNKRMRNQFSSSVLIDGHLYGVDGNTGRGALTCLRFADGERVWAQKGGYEALMAADGKLIAIDKTGALVVANASPSAYQELARAKVLPSKGAKFWTAPVLANGRIYCRNSKGDLACVDVRGDGAG